MVFYHNIDPVFLSIGPFEVRYYGMIYVLGFVIAYFLFRYFADRGLIGMNKHRVMDLLTYIVIGSLAGARVIYILVYNLRYYLQHPIEMLYIWQGGLSFHGGLIGAVVAAYIFWRRYRFDFWRVADLTMIPLALGLCFGRIGNFINGELYGRVTSLPWGVKFKGAEGFRHPSQLYESAKNLFIFTTLWFMKEKKLPKGFMFWTFVTMYGFLRFWIEFVRQPDPQLGFIIFNLSMGQLLCIPMFFIGLGMLIYLKRKEGGNKKW